jgi:hypothetical protein
VRDPQAVADVLAGAWPEVMGEPPQGGGAIVWANSAPWPRDPARSHAAPYYGLYEGLPPILWTARHPVVTGWAPDATPTGLTGLRRLAERPPWARRPSVVLPDPASAPTPQLATYHAATAALTCRDAAAHVGDALRQSRNESAAYLQYAESMDSLIDDLTTSAWFNEVRHASKPRSPAIDRRPIAGYRNIPITLD